MLKPYIARAMHQENLSLEEAEQAMQIIMSGQATDAQIGGYLVALNMKGETVDEIAGSARAMRAHASQVPFVVNGDPLLDTAGTGGDGAQTFNISTATACVVAGAGRKVAKHGNRAASSRCGSADVLAALGVNLELTPEQVAACIEQVGIGFIFAPRFHPAMKYAIGPRRELGQRTIFNLLGPLTNPAGATHQLIGVYDPKLTEMMAEVLGSLGGQGGVCGQWSRRAGRAHHQRAEPGQPSPGWARAHLRVRCLRPGLAPRRGGRAARRRPGRERRHPALDPEWGRTAARAGMWCC